MRIAAIDLGTNSFHLLAVDAHPDGTFVPLVREKEMLRLGDAVSRDGRISDRLMEEAVAAVRRFGAMAAGVGCEEVVACATSAVREADNGSELVDRIAAETGVTPRVISGRDEARLIFAAVRASVLLDPGPALCFDLGGGSLEIMVGDRAGLLWSTSLKLGVARLTAELVESDPLSAFRLGQRFCREPHSRRIRIGDPVRYKSLPFFIDNAAVRRSIWRGIHFNEHLPTGADRVWARQAVLASCTIAYAPDALVVKPERSSLRRVYRLALTTGYTDAHFGDEGGTLWPDSRRFAKRAAWYLLRGFAWGQLPYLAIEDAAERYGYKLGRRLDRLTPTPTHGIAPNVPENRRASDVGDLAA